MVVWRSAVPIPPAVNGTPEEAKTIAKPASPAAISKGMIPSAAASVAPKGNLSLEMVAKGTEFGEAELFSTNLRTGAHAQKRFHDARAFDTQR